MKRYIWKKNPKVPTIVVVGAGFAGINFVKAVRKRDCEVVIIDKHNYHHWHARRRCRRELHLCQW